MVKVISRNEESNNLFNIETNTNSGNPTLTAANLYLNGFTINQEGNIDIPNVGEIFVLNQTLEEAEQTILKKAEDYLINPFVVVKLANFQFTILGEVNNSGNFPVYKEGLTIYDAIAMAGGINMQFAQFYGGTSLLILVGVVLDTLQQIESHLLMRHYDGLMDSGRIKGKSSGNMM